MISTHVEIDKERLALLERAMAKAPRRMVDSSRRGLLRIANKFVGKKGRPGIARRKLASVNRGKGAGMFAPPAESRRWTARAVNATIRARITNGKSMRMQLHMGTLGEAKAPFAKRVRAIDKNYPGGRTMSPVRGKYMLIPAWRNIARSPNAPAITARLRGKRGIRTLVETGGLTTVARGGKLYVYDTKQQRKNKRGRLKSALVAVGVQSATIKAKIDIYGMWSQKEKLYMKQFGNELKRSARSIIKGY